MIGRGILHGHAQKTADGQRELPAEAQAKVLRFLEVGEVHPIGEAYPIKVNVRMLFATNDNLEKAVQESRFREDLFYRLNVISVEIPPCGNVARRFLSS